MSYGLPQPASKINATRIPQPAQPVATVNMVRPKPQEQVITQLRDTQNELLAMRQEMEQLKQQRRKPEIRRASMPEMTRLKSTPVKTLPPLPRRKSNARLADDEFQKLRAKYEEACIARNILDKDGNRVPTWKDGLASAVPVLFRPYCEWASMITHNLEQKGFFAPYNRAVGHEVMAEIAKNFGPSFYKIVPEDSCVRLGKDISVLVRI